MPKNNEIREGTYYFKSNHGSGTNMPIEFPLSDEARRRLNSKAAFWLKKIHNERLSLWWYEMMPRRIYLEEDLRGLDGDAPDWKFFVCNGKVEIFQVDVGRRTNHVQTIYDRNGSFLKSELYYTSGDPVVLPEFLPDMIEVAEGIGTNFDFIRVDMFIHNRKVYLGEIGLVPNGATIPIRSPEIDERLGRAWFAPWMGKVEQNWGNGHYANVQYEKFEY
nr:ATP-grasp fold amidoligase family protein [Ruegeria arenilitoris]